MNPIIIEVRIPENQIESLVQLAGGESDFLSAISRSAAQGVARAAQDHLREYDDSHPNKNSWPRSHFVRGLSDDIQLEEGSVSASGATITASPEFFHKLNGGDVSPIRKKYLAIPERGSAYAAGSPGEGKTPTLSLLLSNKGGVKHVIGLALIEGSPKIAFAHQGLDAQIWYWLVKGPVHHDGDPNILPSDDELHTAAMDGVNEILSMVVEGVAS